MSRLPTDSGIHTSMQDDREINVFDSGKQFLNNYFEVLKFILSIIIIKQT